MRFHNSTNTRGSLCSRLLNCFPRFREQTTTTRWFSARAQEDNPPQIHSHISREEETLFGDSSLSSIENEEEKASESLVRLDLTRTEEILKPLTHDITNIGAKHSPNKIRLDLNQTEEILKSKTDDLVDEFSTPNRSSDHSGMVGSDSDVELDKIINEFLKNTEKIKKLNRNELSLTLTPDKTIDKIYEHLSQCNILVIGEATHDDNTVWNIFSKIHPSTLYKNGIKFIFVEHLFKEHIELLKKNTFGEIIDHLNMYAFFRPNSISPAEIMVDFLKKCLDCDIKIIALDNKNIYNKHVKVEKRIPLLNHETIELVRAEDINEDNKALIYIGVTHTNHYNSIDEKTIGVSEILDNCHEIILKDAMITDILPSSIGAGCVINVKFKGSSQ